MKLEEVRELLNVIEDKILFDSYFVGGCVRDEFLNREPNDFDLVVNKQNGASILSFLIKKHFGNKVSYPVKMKKYPIYSLTFKGDVKVGDKFYNTKDVTLEISDTMTESYPNKNSRQRKVVYANLKEDKERRDFSINSGYMNIKSGKCLDYDFLCDIKKGVIKCNEGVDYDKIFFEDPLRILRGLVFSVRFGFEIEEKTKDSMKRQSNRLECISRERMNKEVEKAFNVENGAYQLIKKMSEMDILKYVFPDIERQKNVYQWVNIDGKYYSDSRGIHLEGETVYDHTLFTLKHIEKGWENGICALFHDIGKTNYTRKQLPNETVSFAGHDAFGLNGLENRLKKKYKFSNDLVNKILFVCKNHMRIYHLQEASDKTLRRFIREIKDNDLDLLFRVCDADTKGTEKSEDAKFSKLNYSLVERINNLKNEKEETQEKNILTGDDIMEIFSIPSGKKVGELLRIVTDLQDEYGNSLTKEFAIDELKKRYKENQDEIESIRNTSVGETI